MQFPKVARFATTMKPIRFAIVLISLCYLLAVPLFAQNGITLNGFIKDARSSETLIAANVYILETLQGATSNNSGYYTIPDVQPGSYTLVASYIGYQDYSGKINIEAGRSYRIDIEMKPAVIAGEEVLVEDEQTLEEEKPVGVQELRPLQIKELPAVIEADVFRAIQLLPGIKSASDFSSGLYIRGGSPDQTLILLDRTTVYNPSHFFGFFSTFNADAIKDVRVYKGGYPSEYGGRLGSVIDIYNRDGNRKEFQGRASLGLLASRLTVEGPIKNGSWMFAARRSTLEPVLAVLRENVDNVPDKFYFYDLNGKLNYDPNPNNKISLSFYSGTDLVEFPIADNTEFNLNYGNNTVSGNWTHVFTEKLFSNFTLTGSEYFSTPELQLSGTPFERENTVTDVSVKGDIEYIPSHRFQTKAGFWSGYLKLKVVNKFDRQESFKSLIESAYSSAYMEQTWKPGPRWILKGGLRGSFFDEGNFLRAEPRLSMEHIYSQNILIQAAYGRYYQFLTLITNEAFSGFDTWLTTGRGVKPAWGDQFVLGIKTRPGENYAADLEIYYRTMRDLFELDPRIQDPAGLDYADNFRFGEGYAYGAELFLQKKTGKLHGYIGYTWGTSRRKFPGYNNNEAYPPKYDRIHDLNIVTKYQLTKKWLLTSVFSYATGQAYTDVLGNFVVQPPTGTDERVPFVVGQLNRSRLPAYHRMDISFARKGKFFSLGNYQLQLQIINLYSRRNIWFYSFAFEEDQLERETAEMLPIIPNISFSLDF